MNLETWYSGKCQDKDGNLLDSFSGEGVGFSSIVLLDLAEKFNGKKKPDRKIGDFFKEIIEFLRINIPDAQSLNQDQINQYLTQKRQELIDQNSTGLLGGVSKGISLLITNPPASTRSYLAYIANNLSRHRIVPAAYAQGPGYGFSGLAPFLPIWRITRNLAYIIFALAFILYGFMMMFRVNISAKTVITIQLALPKLILTLLIITFSYAIVGLMVDLMYVMFYAILSMLESQNLIASTPFGNFFIKSTSGQWGLIPSAIFNSVVALPASAIGIINLIIGGPVIFSSLIGLGLFAFGPGFLITLILIIAILITYIKLFLKLITAFLSVVVALIMAPIILLGNVLPGSDAFGPWIRNIFANLSVFPITMTLLLFSYILMIQPLLQPALIVGGDSWTDILGWLGIVDFSPFDTVQEWVFGVQNLASADQGVMPVPLISTPVSLNVLGLAGVAIGTSASLMALMGPLHSASSAV